MELPGFEVTRDGFELLTAPGHLPAAGPFSWAVLEADPFVDFGAGWTARQVVGDAFAGRRGRTSACVVDDVHLLLDLVRNGSGVALVPASYAAKPQGEGLVRTAVPEPDLAWVVHFACRPGAGRPSCSFAELLVAAEVVADVRSVLGERLRA